MSLPLTNPPKPKKHESISSLKKKAWKVFSPYIRKRDADKNGYVACCTCGRVKHWKEGDAGHFIDGRRNSILYDERNVHFQCKPCNGSFINQKFDRHEIKKRYEDFMVKRYGQKVVDELKKLNNEVKQFSRSDLEKIINKYK